MQTATFTATIGIIGVNPYMIPPDEVLAVIFADAGKNKGAIPVKGALNGHPFIQTLVRFSGHWRLYLNNPMRQAAGLVVGDTATVVLSYDEVPRLVPMPEPFRLALEATPAAKAKFEALSPSRQKEIVRYLGRLKSEDVLERNITRALRFLLGEERFVGRDVPE